MDGESVNRTVAGSGDDADLIDDLALVLSRTVVGWEETLGVDLAQHPEVQRVMQRYREWKSIRRGQVNP